MSINRNDIIELMVQVRPILSDKLALKFKGMYPDWKTDIDITQEDIDKGRNRYKVGDILYRTITPHTTQENWKPGIETLSVWVAVDETHEGTLKDPIPAVAGMEYEYGKYYIEGETIYLMNRQGMSEGEKITLAYLPSQLVGQYFEAV